MRFLLFLTLAFNDSYYHIRIKVCEITLITCILLLCITQIPQGQIDLLPVNFFVNNLLSMVALHEDSESHNLECDICDSGDPPVNRCSTCSHFLCEFCTQAHQRGRSTRSHSLMSLEEVKQMGTTVVTKPSLCKEHEGEVMKLFCETCEEAICRDCTIVKHRDHKYTFVKDAFLQGKESLLKILSDTKRKASILREAVDGVSKMKKSVQSSAEQTVEEIINCFDELTACLDARRGELIEKVEELKKAKLKSLELQQEELGTALGSVQSSVEFTERAFENGSEVEILNMCKQMTCRLQDLNSAKWQLEPCIDDGLKFKSDNQLKHEIATFGEVTDVVTCASVSTVTMENGQEGVMYNTLCGQPVKFTIIAKDRSGRKRTEGGDKFGVTIDLVNGPTGDVTVLLPPSLVACGDCYYNFYVRPAEEGNYAVSVMLNGCHVQGSPFMWFVEKWNLLPYSPGSNVGQILLSEENLTAQYQAFPGGTGRYKKQVRRTGGFATNRREVASIPVMPDQIPFPELFQAAPWPLRPDTPQIGIPCDGPTDPVMEALIALSSAPSITCSEPSWSMIAPSNSQHPGTVSRPGVLGSLGFNAGRHLWKVQVFGNILQGLSFGVCSERTDDTPGQLGNWWVWKSQEAHQVLFDSQVKRVSTISDCASNDIIELYLDCEDGTLMMYNQRTQQSDTLGNIMGDVFPVFCLITNGDKISLKN